VRDERIVESADLVDAGVIFGTGFAPFRGGPLHFAANEPKSNVAVLHRPAAE
jgi:3-hydroxyacyl-CoA dehydrogenase/enoyl-CoA hydratase/3-hydroxybutyryl-CoA epimerase